MKNKEYLTWTLLFLFVVISVVIYKNVTCVLDDCSELRVKNGRYCTEHTCSVEGCTAERGVTTSMCSYHFDEHLKNYQSNNKITLTDAQVQKAKEAVAEYTKMLMEKQSNILAVNLINDYPEWVSETSCSFRCNVVREDDNTNLAEIYLRIKSDGTFEVDKLLYND